MLARAKRSIDTKNQQSGLPNFKTTLLLAYISVAQVISIGFPRCIYCKVTKVIRVIKDTGVPNYRYSRTAGTYSDRFLRTYRIRFKSFRAIFTIAFVLRILLQYWPKAIIRAGSFWTALQEASISTHLNCGWLRWVIPPICSFSPLASVSGISPT